MLTPFEDWDNKLEQTIQYSDLPLGSYCIINERDIQTRDKRNVLVLTLISSNMKIYYVFAPNQIRNRIILHKPKKYIFLKHNGLKFGPNRAYWRDVLR